MSINAVNNPKVHHGLARAMPKVHHGLACADPKVHRFQHGLEVNRLWFRIYVGEAEYLSLLGKRLVNL